MYPTFCYFVSGPTIFYYFTFKRNLKMNDQNIIISLFLEDTTSIINAAVLSANMGLEQIVTDTGNLHNSVQENIGIDLSSTGTNVKNFYEDVKKLSESEFEKHFRMSRSTMQKLINYLKSKVTLTQVEAMIVPFEKQIYVTIWILANKETYREVGNLFGLEKSTVSYVFEKICILLSNSRYDFIKWPSAEEQLVTKSYVLEQHGFPNCVGFIDGCHIQILAPAKNPVDFYNRKEVHSVVLQAVCNERLLFTNISLGQTGRAHDARIFRESQLGQELENIISEDIHILGDSAYTLSPRLMTPYRDNGHLSAQEKTYNKAQSGARAYIERAFGLLKGKFRRLKYLELHKADNSSVVICAACVLHNFIILNEGETNVINEIPENINFEGLLSGAEKRNIICNFISRE